MEVSSGPERVLFRTPLRYEADLVATALTGAGVPHVLSSLAFGGQDPGRARSAGALAGDFVIVVPAASAALAEQLLERALGWCDPDPLLPRQRRTSRLGTRILSSLVIVVFLGLGAAIAVTIISSLG